MTTTLESVKPSFEKLKIKLKEMTENTLKVDVKQKEIINQANEINNIFSNSITNNITDHKVINAAEEKIKELKNRIEKSRGKIALIKDKLKKLKDINAKKEIILDN